MNPSNSSGDNLDYLCLDFEGVLIPEIWQEVSKATGIEDLMLTTQDLESYEELMDIRLKLVSENNITIHDIMEIVEKMEPMDGAADFLSWARDNFQVSIVSDSFYELCWPLVRKLNFPHLICHHLELNGSEITGYKLKQDNNKQKVIEAIKETMKFKVFAAGDSYNDINMLNTADQGFFFQAPSHIKEKYPQLETIEDHNELKNKLENYL